MFPVSMDSKDMRMEVDLANPALHACPSVPRRQGTLGFHSILNTMKRIQSSAAALLCALFITVLSLVGCKQDEVQPVSVPELQQLPGKHKRTVTLRDGDNVITLGIAADNAARLDQFEAQASVEASLEKTTIADLDGALAPAMQPAASAVEWSADDVHIMVLSSSLAAGVQSLKLKMRAPTSATSEDLSNAHAGYFAGQHVFHSYSAPHRFSIYPIVGNLHVWFFYRYNSGTIWNHYYQFHGNVAHHLWNTNNNVDIAAKVNSTYYYIIWE